MALVPGNKIGSYEILSPLGAGGMGEVYRARDMRLGRDVALKVLPAAFCSDGERMARFEREAKVLASLNHPNVAAVYGLEDSNGVLALVMELVEGPTLDEQIARGPIPVDEALATAQQMCEGLEYAHERGIIHRDLKPANVKLTRDGQAKILDFGLAKALDTGSGSAADPASSPTITHLATQAGIILGTAAYMSPEQAKGKAVDRRADIWAFGCVLYEMLTGKRAFTGEDISETLAAVIRDEPGWKSLPPAVPLRIRELLRRCLAKDAKQRLQAIGDARITIEEVRRDKDSGLGSAPLVGKEPSLGDRTQRLLPWAVAVMMAVALGTTLILVRGGTHPTHGPVMHLTLTAQPRHAEGDEASGLAISRDGSKVAYVAFQGPDTGKREDLVAPQTATFEIVVRKLNELTPTPLAGTVGGSGPFFSPDGRWVGFFGGGAIKKISSDGGPPVTLCEASSIAGASWGDDGFIYFAPSGVAEIHRVPEEGGTPAVVVKAANGEKTASFKWPQILPGGKTVLYTATDVTWLAQHYRTEAYSLSDGKRVVVMEEGSNARYLAPGYLVFTRGSVLMGAPFDATGLKVTGPAVPMVEGVTRDEWMGAADYAIASNGTLIYLTGGVQTDFRLMSVDMAGKVDPVSTQVRGFEDLSISPDGKRIAATLDEGGRADLWIYDRERDSLTRITERGDCGDPLWSPDGRHIIYTNPSGLWVVPADGSTPPVALNTEKWGEPDSFSPDGKELLYSTFSPATNEAALWRIPMEAGAKPTQMFPGVDRVADARFSPDGHWIVFVSAQSGRSQVYVQPYPGPGERMQVSTDGGREPIWSADGSKLYYRSATKLISVHVKTNGGLALGKPRILFEGEFVLSHHDYGLLPDGKHLIMIQPLGKTPPTELHVVVNWSDELNARLAAARQ